MEIVNGVTRAWPADVVRFARENGVEQYLDPVREMAREAFPGLKDIQVEVEREYDYPFETYLMWQITTPRLDREAYTAQTAVWYRRLREIVPSDKSSLFSKQVLSVRE